MLNAWWQFSSFPDAKYLKCHHSHHTAYFLCHLDLFGCQDEFPNGADISVTVSWDKPSESMLTRTVSTRQLWNQYHLNPDPFSPPDRFFLCPQMPWKHSCCGFCPWAVMTVQLLLWRLMMLVAWCCGTRKERLKCHPSTVQAALAALSAAWPSSTGCRTLTRAVFLWPTTRTS